MFVATISEAEADGRIAEIYAAERAQRGYVMSGTQVWTARPDMLPAWEDFFMHLRAGTSLSDREWILIGLLASLRVPTSYCAAEYGRRAIDVLGSREAVAAFVRDFRRCGLPDREVAMLDYAEKVATRAWAARQEDIDGLRRHGFSDVQIADIALAAAVRGFMSRVNDALGAGPEAAILDADPDFRALLAVGRPVPVPEASAG
ncbi:MAG TPA: peroxidase-related enzyme [Amaricoccus sp.]|uniref:peroxidase-related enzyme n=1 Tax=Amaricoccus sp. TaxID=1872485 RepID=UPI002CD480D6|nr:peroxidase-related enzyme [Amaricoccus sp.]HMQ94400.1 peroxidase-related enzyme [Amaricoccus sp.]HMR54486.1 peroxidase-related enzyme [Amaricoccus sp.]HMR61710.1 peroxidase-related enzyme [Amaricoccus sp.]HMU01511.1 peroxidase-related enzyme [Amaricoccus sp.]